MITQIWKSLVVSAILVFARFDIATGDLVTDKVTSINRTIEMHYVTTKDGYILLLHRIRPMEAPKKLNSTKSNVMLFVHGLLGSSANYVARPDTSAGYYFSELRYDVWIGNVRGNMFSRNHTTLSADDPSFWKFSFHEIGVIDLPAMIDYILLQTNQTQLIYTGHSQGGTVFLILLCELPEFSEKISLANLMAPGVFFKNSTPLLSLLSRNIDFIQAWAASVGLYEVFSFEAFNRALRSYAEICLNPMISDICRFLVDSSAGPASPKSWYNGLVLEIAQSFPSGASSQQLLHFAQLVRNGTKFQKYDYGYEKNLKLYGTPYPAEYNLSNIGTTKIHLMFGTNDAIVMKENIPLLAEKINSNIIKTTRIPFNHVEFIYGRALLQVQKSIYNVINLYT